MTKISGLKRPILGLEQEQVKPIHSVNLISANLISANLIVYVFMTAVDRRRVRRRVLASDGTELKLAFPTGTVLIQGSLLDTIAGVDYVVQAAAEDVAVIRPRNMAETAKIAHAIGNLHRDFVEDGDVFLVLWDAPIELLLTRLSVPFSREQRPFYGRPSWEHTADSANPELTNPELTNPELTNPELTNPELTNPKLSTGTQKQ